MGDESPIIIGPANPPCIVIFDDVIVASFKGVNYVGGMKNMLFAQFTDTHITTQSELFIPGRDPKKQLENIIHVLNKHPGKPAFALLTGDCTNEGDPAEYRILKKVLCKLQMPCFIIPGNHDHREHLRQAFPDNFPHNGFLHYAIDDYPIRFIGVDSLKNDHHYGELCEERLQWLHECLNQAPSKPTILFMHHPPITCGIPIVDQNNNHSANELAKVLSLHPQVKHILCGHYHQSLQTIWRGISVTVLGSTVAQLIHNPPSFEWSKEPPAFALHRWINANLITQFCGI